MPVGEARSDERRAYHRAYDAARKARDPEYAARRARPPARTDERRAYERERHARRMASDAGYREAIRAKKRRHHAKHAERLNARRVRRQRDNWPRERARVERGSLKRRALLAGSAFVEDVDRAVVFERDHGVCGICEAPTDPADFHIDHIVPLALGGEHSYANVQVAHPRCNMRKNARPERKAA